MRRRKIILRKNQGLHTGTQDTVGQRSERVTPIAEQGIVDLIHDSGLSGFSTIRNSDSRATITTAAILLVFVLTGNLG